MQREEKQLDATLDVLIQRVAEVKNNIAAFLMKLEHEYETLNWPTMLDNFALLSGQISSLNRLMKNEKMPIFRNYALLPLVLSPDRDPQLEKLTEGRVVSFNHDVVPDYLRTKPEPEVEEKIAQSTSRGNSIPQETFQKQLNHLNKVINHITDTIQSSREETENEINQKTAPAQNSLQTDTNNLIAAVTFGKNLVRPVRQARGPGGDAQSPAAGMGSMGPQQHGTMPPGGITHPGAQGYQHPGAPGYYPQAQQSPLKSLLLAD